MWIDWPLPGRDRLSQFVRPFQDHARNAGLRHLAWRSIVRFHRIAHGTFLCFLYGSALVVHRRLGIVCPYLPHTRALRTTIVEPVTTLARRRIDTVFTQLVREPKSPPEKIGLPRTQTRFVRTVDVARKRQIAALLFEKTGIKVTEDDPAFLLVDLNLIVLESHRSQVADEINKSVETLRKTATQSIDDFVAVANEALSKFSLRTKELRASVDALNFSVPNAKTAMALPAHELLANDPNASGSRSSRAIYWLLAFLIFATGLATGTSLMLLFAR
jgi:hypothetical protein